MGTGSDRRVKAAFPGLYPILDTAAFEARGYPLIRSASVLLETGVRILQYRHKAAFTEDRLQEAKQISALCRAHEAVFIMNDRADFAHLLGAGLHLGQDDLPPAAARRVVGPDAFLGFSTHNEAQLRSAANLPINYVALGPIFTTASKQNPDPVVGLEQLKHLRLLVSQPLVAIGGITLSTATSVLENGADSVAVISALLPDQPGDWGEFSRRAGEWLKAVEA